MCVYLHAHPNLSTLASILTWRLESDCSDIYYVCRTRVFSVNSISSVVTLICSLGDKDSSGKILPTIFLIFYFGPAITQCVQTNIQDTHDIYLVVDHSARFFPTRKEKKGHSNPHTARTSLKEPFSLFFPPLLYVEEIALRLPPVLLLPVCCSA